MTFDAGRAKAPLLTMFGGDVTTSRRRAEIAVNKLDSVLSDVAALDREERRCRVVILPVPASTTRSTARRRAGAS